MSSSNIKALIALSEQDMAAQVALVMAHCGILNPLIVTSTYEAIDAMVEDSFNLFIVDAPIPMSLDRPGTRGGIDFIRFVRMCEGATSKAVVVFLRSKIGNINMLEVHDEMIEVKKAGANCIVARPFTLDKFKKDIVPELVNQRIFLRSDAYPGAYRRLVPGGEDSNGQDGE